MRRRAPWLRPSAAGFSILLLIAALLTGVGVASPAYAATITLDVDDQSTGREFDGIGSLSAGASSRLLVDYPETQRSAILDYLFKPGYGAAQQILKVEIGGDTNSTDGSEPSHKHTRDDLDCSRGYEWWLMEEAKTRNPQIKFSALAWGAPGWIGKDDPNNPTPGQPYFWSQDMIDYLISWLDCAAGKGFHIDYLGGWNESGANMDWFIKLRAALDATSYSDIKLVADDGFHWSVAKSMKDNPGFNAAVAVVGQHYPCGLFLLSPISDNCPSTADAVALGKPLHASEMGAQGYDAGAASLARAHNHQYIDGKMTSAINWATVWSAYRGLPFGDSGLMLADTPWSGAYTVGKSIWATAHTTQFTSIGWKYVDDATRELTGGSVVTLRDPVDGDWSSIVETSQASADQTLSYQLSGGIKAGTVHVWASNLKSADSSAWFVKQQDISVQNSSFTFTAKAGYLYSLTTTTGQGKGTATSPAARAWGLPYTEDFDQYADGATPKYISDLGSTFEVTPCTGGRTGKCLRSIIDQQPIQWNTVARLLVGHYNYPLTVVGDPHDLQNWRDYRVSLSAMLEKAGTVELAGRSRNGKSGYRLSVSDTGAWRLWRGGGQTLASGQTTFGVSKWHTLALDLNGTQIMAFLDDTPLASVKDGTYTVGQVDIAGSPWTPFQVDDLSVSPPKQPVNASTLKARHSGKCLNVRFASTADWAPVIQYTCVGATNEQWLIQGVGDGYYRLVARHSGKCLNVRFASRADGAPVIQYTCVGATNEQWSIQDVGDGYYRLVARHSGKCLNVDGASTADWASVIQSTCVGATNEQWSGLSF